MNASNPKTHIQRKKKCIKTIDSEENNYNINRFLLPDLRHRKIINNHVVSSEVVSKSIVFLMISRVRKKICVCLSLTLGNRNLLLIVETQTKI